MKIEEHEEIRDPEGQIPDVIWEQSLAAGFHHFRIHFDELAETIRDRLKRELDVLNDALTR